MDYFSLCLDILCLAAQSIMHLLFIGRLTGKNLKPRYMAAYFFLLCTFDRIAIRLSVAWVLSIAGELLILYGISRFVLKNRRAVSWAAAILALYISQLSFGIINSVESVLFPRLIGKPILYVLVFLAAAVSLFFCTCCYAIVLKYLSLKDGEHTPDNEWFLFPVFIFPILFFFAAELYIMQTSYTQVLYVSSARDLSLTETGKHFALLFLQFLGLSALFCTLYAYRRVCLSLQAQAALNALSQAVQTQKIYVAEAQTRYEQTKAFRHDVKNHLSVLNGFLTNGKPEEARSYLQSMQAASSSLSFPCHTGNAVADILLNEKLSLAKANGIAADVSLILPESCAIDDFDLCVILSNALDNAVNACRTLDGDTKIQISGEKQGDFYMLEFKNTCPEGSLPPAGTGLSNIRTIAEKYHGAMLTEKTDREFSLNVLLNISLHPENIPIQKP